MLGLLPRAMLGNNIVHRCWSCCVPDLLSRTMLCVRSVPSRKLISEAILAGSIHWNTSFPLVAQTAHSRAMSVQSYATGEHVFVRCETGRHTVWTVVRDRGDRVVVSRKESPYDDDTTEERGFHIELSVDKKYVFPSTAACIDARRHRSPRRCAVQNIPFHHDYNMIVET